MEIARLAPAGLPLQQRRRWTVAASVLLHAAAFAALLSITARRPSLEDGGGAPSYDLVFDEGRAGTQGPVPPTLPPAQPAEISPPENVLAGSSAPSPTSEPAPDGVPSDLPEAAVAAAPPPTHVDPPAPAEATAPLVPAAAPAGPPVAAVAPSPPTELTPAPSALAFAPEAVPAEAPPPSVEVVPAPSPPPSVRLEAPPEAAPPRQQAMIMPQPPPPLPPAPPRVRPAPRPAPGTLFNPMDLSFGPAAPRPAPAARGSVASRAIDLSPGPPRDGPARSDLYADIRAANASADWNRGLLSYWLRHRYYPQQARENGEDGTVVVELTVNRSGRVESVEVKSRSGSQWLDMAAVGTFRSGQLPPFTPEMREDRITFSIPIHYILMR